MHMRPLVARETDEEETESSTLVPRLDAQQMDAAIVSCPGHRSADRRGRDSETSTSPIRRWRARADADAAVASTTIAIIMGWIDPLSKHQPPSPSSFSHMGGLMVT